MTIKLTETDHELKQILALQQLNHFENLLEAKKKQNGFVTVKHDFDLLAKMNSKAKQVIAVDKGQVVAYALVMLKELNIIPVLQPMFEKFDSMLYDDKIVSDYEFYIMGQICVADSHKRQGIFHQLYQKHKEVYSSQFEICLTEVSSSNIPSMKAHEKVGFKSILKYADHNDEWNILLWDWR